jgi:hypothetical protein
MFFKLLDAIAVMKPPREKPTKDILLAGTPFFSNLVTCLDSCSAYLKGWVLAGR